jgi:hypothetical protein
MSNANVQIITTANSFYTWMVNDNNIANSVNNLRNSNYVKDNGSFIVANGSLQTTTTTGTGLSIASNALLSQLTTMNTQITTGQASFGLNVGMTNANSTTTIAGNLIVGVNTTLGNLTVQGSQTIVGNTILATDTLILRSTLATSGNGNFIIEQGGTNGNAELKFIKASNVWAVTDNAQNGFLTVLSTSNIVDSVTNSNTAAFVASANAVEWAYNTAINAYTQANTANVYANSALPLAAGFNFPLTGPLWLTSLSAQFIQKGTSANANTALWTQYVDSAGNFVVQARNDNQTNVNNLLVSSRSNGTSNITAVTYGNIQDQPIHSFNGIVLFNGGVRIQNTATTLDFYNAAGAANSKFWDIYQDPSSNFHFRYVNDSYSTATDFLNATRSGMSITAMNYGDNANLALTTHTFYGKLFVGGSGGTYNLPALVNIVYGVANTASGSGVGAYGQANAAYAQANTALVDAEAAYAQANTALVDAEAAYATANTALVDAEAAYAAANSSTTIATNAYTQANGAYAEAIIALSVAENAYAEANTLAFPAQSIVGGAGGYTTLPGGLIMQWGTGVGGVSPESVTFPVQFPHATFSVVATPIAPSTSESFGLQNISTTGFQLAVGASGYGFKWIALGN